MVFTRQNTSQRKILYSKIKNHLPDWKKGNSSCQQYDNKKILWYQLNVTCHIHSNCVQSSKPCVLLLLSGYESYRGGTYL